VHIFSCSVDCEESTQGEEGMSVLSTTQITQTRSGEQTGTCDSEHFKSLLYLFFPTKTTHVTSEIIFCLSLIT